MDDDDEAVIASSLFNFIYFILRIFFAAHEQVTSHRRRHCVWIKIYISLCLKKIHVTTSSTIT